jgi:hypothetical protein
MALLVVTGVAVGATFTAGDPDDSERQQARVERSEQVAAKRARSLNSARREVAVLRIRLEAGRQRARRAIRRTARLRREVRRTRRALVRARETTP